MRSVPDVEFSLSNQINTRYKMAQRIETVFAPDLYKFHDKCQNVVLIDVARFTSTMVTALANGALCVETYPDTETPLRLKREKGYLIAGEVRGRDIEGFDFNNSPISMNRDNVGGQKLAFCTSNGTYARSIVTDCEKIYAAAFLNSTAVSDRLTRDGKSVLLLCSGRSRKPAIEDILLAGQIAQRLIATGKFETTDECTNMAIQLYNMGKDDIMAYVLGMYPRMADFSKRFPKFQKDIEFVFHNQDIYDIVPEDVANGRFMPTSR